MRGMRGCGVREVGGERVGGLWRLSDSLLLSAEARGFREYKPCVQSWAPGATDWLRAGRRALSALAGRRTLAQPAVDGAGTLLALLLVSQSLPLHLPFGRLAPREVDCATPGCRMPQMTEE